MRFLSIFLFSFYCFSIKAQQQVIATSGNFFQNTSGTISWTMGEPVITTLSSENKVLNQGFQQSGYELKSGTTDQIQKFCVWPNPTCGNLILHVEEPNSQTYKLYNILGTLLESKPVSEVTNEINLSYFNSGVYLLKIFSGEKEVYTIEIIKN